MYFTVAASSKLPLRTTVSVTLPAASATVAVFGEKLKVLSLSRMVTTVTAVGPVIEVPPVSSTGGERVTTKFLSKSTKLLLVIGTRRMALVTPGANIRVPFVAP